MQEVSKTAELLRHQFDHGEPAGPLRHAARASAPAPRAKSSGRGYPRTALPTRPAPTDGQRVFGTPSWRQTEEAVTTATPRHGVDQPVSLIESAAGPVAGGSGREGHRGCARHGPATDPPRLPRPAPRSSPTWPCRPSAMSTRHDHPRRSTATPSVLQGGSDPLVASVVEVGSLAERGGHQDRWFRSAGVGTAAIRCWRSVGRRRSPATTDLPPCSPPCVRL
jgi:hypothetical protein